MKKQIRIISTLVFIVLLFFLLILSYNQVNDTNMQEREVYYDREKIFIESSKKVMLNQISIILADLNFIGNNIASMESLGVELDYIKELWKEFIESKNFYDQLRFIDKGGFEKVRVNYSDGISEIVSDDQLQSKASRYYFKDTIALEAEAYYISRLDLNVENGNIEIPYKPMIRFAKPVYRDQELLGVAVINYLANYLLEVFVDNLENSDASDVFLLNEEGYWLLSSNRQFVEWGFMFDEHEKVSMKYIEPMVWQEIKNKTFGDFETEEGIYVFSTVLPETRKDQSFNNIDEDKIYLGEGNWYIVTFLSNKDENFSEIYKIFSYINFLFTERLGLTLGVIISVLVFSILLAWYLKHKIQVEKLAKYDEMTLAYNRHYGLEKAEELYKETKRNHLNLGVVFCDINGLKHVNDTYGHIAGDDLITSFSKAIQKHIRWQQRYFVEEWLYNHHLSFKKKTKGRDRDIMIRLGGDEFLIIFRDIDENVLEEIWKRITMELNETYIRNVQVSASYGVVVLTSEMDISLDKAINLADEAMYLNKKKYYINQE